MDNSDDAEILRGLASADTEDRSRTRPGAVAGRPTLLVKTTTVSTYPTVAGRFYACIVQGLLGTESEGSSGILTPGATIYAYNLGASIPATGTQVLATFVRYRWVFRYG